MPFRTEDAITNMAIDESLFKSKIQNPTQPNTIRFYSWNPSAVTIGKNQDLHTEVDVIQAQQLGIDVTRRISGGGAVFHDYKGEITYCIVVSRRSLNNITPAQFYQRVISVITHACSLLGVNSEYAKIQCPSVFVHGQKISGNAQAVHKDVILQHGTILIDYNPELMYSVLKARPDKPKKKMVESVYAHITTLSRILNRSVTIYEIIPLLKQSFQKVFNVKNWEAGLLSEKGLVKLSSLKN